MGPQHIFEESSRFVDVRSGRQPDLCGLQTAGNGVGLKPKYGSRTSATGYSDITIDVVHGVRVAGDSSISNRDNGHLALCRAGMPKYHPCPATQKHAEHADWRQKGY